MRLIITIVITLLLGGPYSLVSLTVNAGADITLCYPSTDTSPELVINGGTGPYSILWSGGVYGDFSSRTVISPVITPQLDKRNTYYVKVTDAFGNVAYDTLIVYKGIQITVDMNEGFSPHNTLCQGDNAVIGSNAFVVGGTWPFTYSWSSTPSIAMQGLDDRNVKNAKYTPATESGSVSFTLEVKDSVGCVMRSNENYVLHVNPSPKIDLGGDSSSFCEGKNVSLRNQVINNNTISQWYKGSIFNYYSNELNITVSDPEDYYLLEVDITNNCSSIKKITLAVIKEPDFDIILPTTKQCANEPILLTVENLRPRGGVFEWNLENGIGSIQVIGDKKAVYTPNHKDDPQELRFSALYTTSCGNIIKTGKYTTEVTPVAGFDTDTKKGQPYEEITFENRSKGAISDYQWYFQNGSIDSSNTANSQVLTWDEAGDYIISLKVENTLGCQDSISKIFKVFDRELIYIPNAFSTSSRNQDNKCLKLYYQNLDHSEDFEFVVFARKGGEVFRTHDIIEAQESGWNGRVHNTGQAVLPGVYTYTIRARYISGEKIEKAGTITLMK